MLNKMGYLLTFVFGTVLGCSVIYIHFYTQPSLHSIDALSLEKILMHSNTVIPHENNGCNGDEENTIGDVVASLIALNSFNKINQLTGGCSHDRCTLSLTDCKPWQRSECSSRFLKFELDRYQHINTNTLSCFDMP